MKPTTKEARARALGIIAKSWADRGFPDSAQQIAEQDVWVVDAMLEFAADAGPGWRVVPETLTDEMHEAVVKLDFTATHDPLWPEYWAAMLSAAPAPDAKEEG